MNLYPEAYSSEEDDPFDDAEEFKQKLKLLQQERLFNLANESIDPETTKKVLIYNAILDENLDTVCEILDNGFNIESNLREGWTPLLLAASYGKSQIVEELIKRGANVNQTLENCTVLMIACDCKFQEDESHRFETVRLLVENGANLNAIDSKRKTAFMAAAYGGNLAVVKYLLPLCDKFAEDNQKWNALFWAVEGKRLNVVKYLLEEGFNPEKVDIRGDTAKDVANSYGFEEISQLFPEKEEEDYQICKYVNKTPVNFDELFENLKRKQQPRFFEDICRILYSIRNDSIIPKLAEKDINLCDFLSVTDEDLKKLGLQMPFQRNRILNALYKFHMNPYHPKSIVFVPKNEKYSNIDVSQVILAAVKQVIAMEAALKFMMKHYDGKLSPNDITEVTESTQRMKNQIENLKIIIQELRIKAEWWDYSLAPADFITKKRTNIPWSNLIMSFFILSSFVVFKIFK